MPRLARILFIGPLLGGAAAPAAEPPPAPVEAVETIVVTGRKLTVETLIDRTSYSVAADVQAAFGSVSDVLGAIPSVDVDADGKVSLRGDGNVLVLIDGKPSAQFSGATAGDALQSMPARDIERIEVITTPPAQFKADGAAGIINIITRRKRPAGVAGNLQGSLGSGGRSVAGASASYGGERLTASATAGFRHDARARLVASTVQSTDATTGVVSGSTSALNERLLRQAPSAGVSAEYAFDERDSLSGSASWSRRGGLRTYTQLNQVTSATGAVTAASERLSSGHDPNDSDDARVGYTHKFERAGEQLELSAHRSKSYQWEHYDYRNASLVPAAAPFYNNLTFTEEPTSTELNLDYALPLDKTRTLKLGVAIEWQDYRNSNAGNVVDPLTGTESVDPLITNDFRFHQKVRAGYASYQADVGSWTWLAGLRAESVRTDTLQLVGNVANAGNYTRAYPSLHLERRLSEERTLSFGASRRISRPDPDALNPYVDYEYTPNLSAGNPQLRPQYTQSFEAGYGYEGRGRSWRVNAYYRINQDTATDVTRYLGNGFSLATVANLPRLDSGGMEFNASGRLLPQLAWTANGNAFRSQVDASALGTPGLRSTTGLNLKLKLDFRPTAADSAQLQFSRTDRRLTAQGEIQAINVVNLGYRHQLSNALTVIATLSDAFNGQRNERIVAAPGLQGDYLRQTRGRVLFVGASYSFGTSKKDKAAGFDYDQG